jgi:serine/threonine protein kinase
MKARLEQTVVPTDAELAVVDGALGAAAGDGTPAEQRQLEQLRVPWDSLTLIEPLGAGAFAEVWAASMTGAERRVAVKRLHRLFLTDAAAMARFRAEILTMAPLRHANVARMYGAVWEPPHVALIMELFNGGSCAAALASRAVRLSWADPLRRWLEDVCLGMVYLHGRGVVHRDLKAENCMLSNSWGAVVADLGEARTVVYDETMTACGTPHWAAPEVLRGEHFDASADVYSYAILVFEFAARTRPYQGVHPSRLLTSVCNGSLRPTLPPSTPPAVARLASACWAHDPGMRPAFADILVQLRAPELLAESATATETAGGMLGRATSLQPDDSAA